MSIEMLSKSSFIEYPQDFKGELLAEDPAPVFRRRFQVRPALKKAVLAVCGLGYGYYYINGCPASADLFTAPVSDYTKTLWYNVYDVTDMLKPGENLIAAILGNGFYNEALTSVWGHNNAPWRGAPKLLLELRLIYADKTESVLSDTVWLCSKDDSPVRFNQLRSGETYDSRIGEAWRFTGYDDSSWTNARASKDIPAGVLRECLCQPIREERAYPVVDSFVNEAGNYVLDFGQNMSGYVRLTLKRPAGETVTIRYGEQLNDNNTLESINMEHFYGGYKDFQTDRFIGGGDEAAWSPRFAYHGFRYIELEGLGKYAETDEIEAIFVHQVLEELSAFECSDPLLNDIYRIGKMATLSNLFYMPTDCPTREKLGWANDAQASAEQMLQNFGIASLFEKWMQDVIDSMKEDGAIPGIIPSPGWGYEWGSGPISSGVLFELPMQIYRYTGNDRMLRYAYKTFIKHLKFIMDHADTSDGLIGYGLCDWAGPFEIPDKAPTPVKLSDTLLTIKFHKISIFAARLCGDISEIERLEKSEKELQVAFKAVYIGKNGRCTVHEQTAAAMIIALGVYDSLEPLKFQLRELVEEKNYHHHCGMLGIQYLYAALDICGLQEEAYRIVTAKTRPCYAEWLDNGATTMWEMWHTGESKNHHMYSGVLSWFMKTIAGLGLGDETPAFKKTEIRPCFLKKLNFCKASYKTATGVFGIEWHREGRGVRLNVSVPDGAEAVLAADGYVFYGSDECEKILMPGKYEFMLVKTDIHNKL